MRYILLFIIQCYWRIIPVKNRNKCIYKHSCSKYVYDQVKAYGFFKGLGALTHRIRRCNPYFQIFKNPITGDTELILSTGDVLIESEIAEKLIEKEIDAY